MRGLTASRVVLHHRDQHWTCRQSKLFVNTCMKTVLLSISRGLRAFVTVWFLCAVYKCSYLLSMRSYTVEIVQSNHRVIVFAEGNCSVVLFENSDASAYSVAAVVVLLLFLFSLRWDDQDKLTADDCQLQSSSLWPIRCVKLQNLKTVPSCKSTQIFTNYVDLLQIQSIFDRFVRLEYTETICILRCFTHLKCQKKNAYFIPADKT